MGESRQRVHMIISGRVQGVCFRMYTREEGTRQGLTGWVRNAPDGTVEVLAEGTLAPLQEFVTWCHNGPSHARVMNVKVNYDKPRGEFDSFGIRY